MGIEILAALLIGLILSLVALALVKMTRLRGAL